MSIDSEVTSMTQNIQADYEGLTNLGVDLTGINKNIENIKPCLDTIWNNLPKVSDTGTEVTLSPTLKGKLGIVEKGNSTQESTTGKNLANINNIEGTDLSISNDTIQLSNSVGYNSTSNDCLLKDICPNLQAGQTYTLSFDNTDTTMERNNKIYLITSQEYWTKGTTRTITQNDLDGRVAFYGVNATISNFMISTSGGDYEKYTGGIPAPNPSYSFPIKSVTGNNNVVVENKNILKFTQAKTLTSGDLTATCNDNTTITINGTSSGMVAMGFDLDTKLLNGTYKLSGYTRNDTYLQLYTKNSSGTIRVINMRNTPTLSFTNETLFQVFIFVANGTTATFNNETFNLQLELGSTATSYEEHKEQTKPLNLGNIELNGINTYKNLIFKAENGNAYYDSLTAEQKALLTYGKRYYHEEIKTENDLSSLVINTVTEIIDYARIQLVSSENSTSEANGLCNYFKFLASYSGQSNHFYVQSQFIYIIVDKTLLSGYTGQDVRNFFNSLTGLEVKYIKATPTDTQITDTTLISQLEEIDKMQSYNGTTIITSTYDSNNAQMYLQVSSLKGE